MLRKLTVSAIFSGSLLFNACDNSTGSGSIDAANLIGAWINTSMTINPGIDLGAGVVTDYFSFLPTCQHDDVTTFSGSGTSGNFTNTEGATSCSPPNTDAGTWSLSGSTMTMTSTGDTTSEVFTISSLTATSVTVQQTIPASETPDDVARTVTITAHKQ